MSCRPNPHSFWPFSLLVKLLSACDDWKAHAVVEWVALADGEQVQAPSFGAVLTCGGALSCPGGGVLTAELVPSSVYLLALHGGEVVHMEVKVLIKGSMSPLLLSWHLP